MRISSPFRKLALTLDLAKGTRSKKEKVNLLAGYLSGLDPDDAEQAGRMATGRVSQIGSTREAQVGYSTLLEALKTITGASEGRLSESYLKRGDLGEVAEELLKAKNEQTLFEEPLTLDDLREAFDDLRNARGKGSGAQRAGVVKSLLLRASPGEGKYIVKMLTGEMRTGLVAGLMEEAISEAYSAPREEVAKAHMLLGDIGLLAKAAASRELGKVRMTTFRPVSFMLAEPISTPSEIADHFGKEVYAEYKYDGVRAQLHKSGGKVRIYSRRMEDITESFPEVRTSAAASPFDFILDGEIVPYEDGRPLPFQLLQRRLRRLDGFEEAARKAPVEFMAFDLLSLGMEDATTLPLSRRRLMLDRACSGTKILRAESEEVSSEADIERVFRRSRALGYEGLVLKDPGSTYAMGKRGSAWVKLKEELDTIDAVIVAAEYGHGKRAGVLSDYTFAVRDGDKLRTIGKAYSGLTDEEINQMTEKFKGITVQDFGFRRSVRPEVVIEVAFDSIQISDRHDSGYALRFPRIKKIRTDKSPEEADTLGRVSEIFRSQKLKVE